MNNLNNCPRCLKMTDGVHTCTPTKQWRKLEQERDDLAKSMRDVLTAAHRLALELECLLLSCKDMAAVSKWWDSAHEALEQWRETCREDVATTGPWCCEKGQAQDKQVCDECAEINAGYQSCLGVREASGEASVPAIVFYPAGSLGEEVESEGGEA